jgi:predicted outer membrane repeat protein
MEDLEVKPLLTKCTLFIGISILSVVTQASVIHVPADQPTIQAGVDAALDSDTVLVADGIYLGDGNRDIDFKGKAITVKSENGAENCIIDCQGSEQELHRGFYFSSNQTILSIVQGFTIQNGHVGYKRGGGIYCDSRSLPTIADCTISNNTAYDGGGIYCHYYSSPTITNCNIANNTADNYGGGICCYYASPKLTDCSISSNMAGIGGGIWCTADTVTFTNCTILNNTASWGGGIYCGYDSNAVITNCIVSNNSAAGNGGGITCWHSYPSVTDCIISNNIASSGAGIRCDSDSSLTLLNCVVSDNTVSSVSGYGGGICSYDSALTIVNCSFSGNASPRNGGGLVWGGDDRESDIRNCIFRNDTPDEIAHVYSSSAKITYSDIQGGYPGIGNIDDDPCFIGGNPYNFQLSLNSPCIDAGTDNGLTTTDLEGNPRPQGGAVDMGAYEFPGWPSITRAYVKMLAHAFIPGDPASCSVSVWNSSNSTLNEYPLFVILDVLGIDYCAPSFSGMDHYEWSFFPGFTELTVLPEFTWPENVGSASDIVWYAFLANPGMTELASDIGVFDFGWSE